MRTDGLGGLRAGAHSKKPRVMRGSERLTTQLSELAGLVLAEREGFEPSIRQKAYTGFRVRRIRPLCHLSTWSNCEV